jgi:RNA polymerase sigma factor (sigma-70 family)
MIAACRPRASLPSCPAAGRREDLALRAARLLTRTIDYVPCPDFAEPPLGQRQAPQPQPERSLAEGAPAAASAYLRSLYRTRLLSADEERELFWWMNYLKYRAEGARQRLEGRRPRLELVAAIEYDLAEAERLRNELVTANLRLVVSVARQMCEAGDVLPELISEGNITLLRAVEKFDVRRGFKFSTYATGALRRNLYRFCLAARDRRRELGAAEGVEPAATALPAGEGPLDEVQYARLRRSVAGLLARLEPREQLVVRLRFGLGADQSEHTLQQMAGRLGVCKERVRQILLRALRKLEPWARRRRIVDNLPESA